jgi:hypothetical protein
LRSVSFPAGFASGDASGFGAGRKASRMRFTRIELVGAPIASLTEIGVEAGEHDVMRGHRHGLGGRRDRREDESR